MSARVASQVSKIYEISNRKASSERVGNIRRLMAEVEPEYVELAWFVTGSVSEKIITKSF